MRRLGSFLVLGVVLSAVPWAQARADCAPQGVDLSPSPGWARDDDRAVDVGPDPTVFAFWRAGLDPGFEVVCEADDAPLPFALETLPSSADTGVAQLAVTTGECTAFAVRPAPERAKYWGHREQTHYVVRANLEPQTDRPRPAVVSAMRINKQFGCGPSSNLRLATNVRPAAMRVEVDADAGAHTIVVPTRLFEADDEPGQGSFWLGRTMCRGPNLHQAALEQGMRVRLSALYADGTTDVGVWQSIDPPEGRADADEESWSVEVPPPEPPSPPACSLATAADPQPEPRRCMGWLWILLAIPGALAIGGYAQWARARRVVADEAER